MAAAQLCGSGMYFTIRLRAVVVGIAVAILFASTAARAERRVALVVGNGAYAHATRLNNPGNDARDMAERLGRLGFDVVQALDVGSEAFDGAVSTFARKLVGADLAMFFYAGHGLQFNGVNYLLPVDTKIEGEYALRRKAVLAQEVIDQMERAAKVSLVFLDACRNNTLLRDLEHSLPEQSRSTASQRGLARMDPRGNNTLIAFATAPNEVAADGTGRNSPFSAALLKHIETANVSVQDMLTSVAGDVLGATNGRQKPEVLSRLSTKVVLLEKFTPLPPPVVIPLPPVATPSKERDASVAWDTLKTSCDRGALDLFRIRYGDTFFGDLAARRVSSIDTAQECASRPTVPVMTQPPIVPPSVAAPVKLTDDEAFVREIQAQLKRVGCYAGTVDGRWGSGSQSSFAAFVTHAKAPSAIVPTREHLEALKSKGGRICPLVCDESEQEADGRCIKKVSLPPGSKGAPNAPPANTRSPETKAEPPKSTASCYKKFDLYGTTCSKTQDGCKSSGGTIKDCNAAYRECMQTGQWVYRRPDGTCFDWGSRSKI
jgi:hypothetical protein